MAGPPPIEEIRWVAGTDGDSATAFANDEVDLAGVAGFDATWIAYDPDLGPRLHAAEPLSVQLLRLRHHAAAVRRRAGAARLRAGARSRAARPPRRGRLLDVRREPRPAGDLAGRLRPRDGARPGRGAAPARRGRVRGPRRPRHDRGQRRRPGSRPGGGGVAGGARRRHRDRGDGLRRLPRHARLEAAGDLHRQLDRGLSLAARDLRAAPRARGRQQLRRLERRSLRPAAARARRARPSRRSGAAYDAVDAYVAEQAPVIPWSYGETWWLVADGLRGLGNLTIGLIDFGRVSWDG